MKVFIFLSLMFSMMPYLDATFLKNREIADLEKEMKEQSDQIAKIDHKVENCVADLTKMPKNQALEQLESRILALELKMMQMEQPGTPGSAVQRRPKIRRGASSNGQNLTPNRAYKDSNSNDYFSPASPYS